MNDRNSSKSTKMQTCFMPKMGFQRKSSFYTLCLVGECNFISSFCLSSFATIAPSAFIYFWVFWSSFVTIFGGLLVIEKKKSPGRSLALKVVKMTWSLTSSTYSNSLLKCATYYCRDSTSACWMLRRWPVGFFCLCPQWNDEQNPCLIVQKLQ